MSDSTAAVAATAVDDSSLLDAASISSSAQFEQLAVAASEKRHPSTSGSTAAALPLPGEYSSNETAWFKAATIAFPICGGIILLILIVLAIRILRYDSLDTPSKLGSCSNTRKFPLDFDAYGASSAAASHQLHNDHSKELPLLFKGSGDHYAHYEPHCHHNDLKNETQAKKNQLMTLEYSLLSQNDTAVIKPSNTELSQAGAEGVAAIDLLYKNVNLSLNSSGGGGGGLGGAGASDNKVYEKEVLHPQTYWNTIPNNNR